MKKKFFGLLIVFTVLASQAQTSITPAAINLAIKRINELVAKEELSSDDIIELRQLIGSIEQRGIRSPAIQSGYAAIKKYEAMQEQPEKKVYEKSTALNELLEPMYRISVTGEDDLNQLITALVAIIEQLTKITHEAGADIAHDYTATFQQLEAAERAITDYLALVQKNFLGNESMTQQIADMQSKLSAQLITIATNYLVQCAQKITIFTTRSIREPNASLAARYDQLMRWQSFITSYHFPASLIPPTLIQELTNQARADQMKLLALVAQRCSSYLAVRAASLKNIWQMPLADEKNIEQHLASTIYDPAIIDPIVGQLILQATTTKEQLEKQFFFTSFVSIVGQSNDQAINKILQELKKNSEMLANEYDHFARQLNQFVSLQGRLMDPKKDTKALAKTGEMVDQFIKDAQQLYLFLIDQKLLPEEWATKRYPRMESAAIPRQEIKEMIEQPAKEGMSKPGAFIASPAILALFKSNALIQFMGATKEKQAIASGNEMVKELILSSMQEVSTVLQQTDQTKKIHQLEIFFNDYEQLKKRLNAKLDDLAARFKSKEILNFAAQFLMDLQKNESLLCSRIMQPISSLVQKINQELGSLDFETSPALAQLNDPESAQKITHSLDQINQLINDLIAWQPILAHPTIHQIIVDFQKKQAELFIRDYGNALWQLLQETQGYTDAICNSYADSIAQPLHEQYMKQPDPALQSLIDRFGSIVKPLFSFLQQRILSVSEPELAAAQQALAAAFAKKSNGDFAIDQQHWAFLELTRKQFDRCYDALQEQFQSTPIEYLELADSPQATAEKIGAAIAGCTTMINALANKFDPILPFYRHYLAAEDVESLITQPGYGDIEKIVTNISDSMNLFDAALANIAAALADKELSDQMRQKIITYCFVVFPALHNFYRALLEKGLIKQTIFDDFMRKRKAIEEKITLPLVTA